MTGKILDSTIYPLEWDKSYTEKGPQWRGGLRISPYLSGMDLSGPMLEIGVGNGNTAAQIVKAMPAQAQLVCLDVSRWALAHLPAQLCSDRRIAFTIADARAMPFQDGVFTAIFARHVLTHTIIGDETRILSEIRRALRPSESVLLEVFTPRDMRFGKGDQIAANVFLRKDGLVWRFFSEDELAWAIDRAGMKLALHEVVSRQVVHMGKKHRRESLVAVARRI